MVSKTTPTVEVGYDASSVTVDEWDAAQMAEKLHSQDAQAYNALVLAWPDLVRLAQSSITPAQTGLDFNRESANES